MRASTCAQCVRAASVMGSGGGARTAGAGRRSSGSTSAPASAAAAAARMAAVICGRRGGATVPVLPRRLRFAARPPSSTSSSPLPLPLLLLSYAAIMAATMPGDMRVVSSSEPTAAAATATAPVVALVGDVEVTRLTPLSGGATAAVCVDTASSARLTPTAAAAAAATGDTSSDGAAVVPASAGARCSSTGSAIPRACTCCRRCPQVAHCTMQHLGRVTSAAAAPVVELYYHLWPLHRGSASVQAVLCVQWRAQQHGNSVRPTPTPPTYTLAPTIIAVPRRRVIPTFTHYHHFGAGWRPAVGSKREGGQKRPTDTENGRFG